MSRPLPDATDSPTLCKHYGVGPAVIKLAMPIAFAKGGPQPKLREPVDKPEFVRPPLPPQPVGPYSLEEDYAHMDAMDIWLQEHRQQMIDHEAKNAAYEDFQAYVQERTRWFLDFDHHMQEAIEEIQTRPAPKPKAVKRPAAAASTIRKRQRTSSSQKTVANQLDEMQVDAEPTHDEGVSGDKSLARQTACEACALKNRICYDTLGARGNSCALCRKWKTKCVSSPSYIGLESEDEGSGDESASVSSAPNRAQTAEEALRNMTRQIGFFTAQTKKMGTESMARNEELIRVAEEIRDHLKQLVLAVEPISATFCRAAQQGSPTTFHIVLKGQATADAMALVGQSNTAL